MIYVECKPDFTLVRFITNLPRKEIVHEFKGKYEVCKQLGKRRHCKGLVDEDPLSVPPSYLEKLRLREEIPERGLKVMHDESNNNLLIILCPRLEDWILRAAKERGINPDKYNLPNNPNRLHEVINLSLDRFERLLEDLKGCERLRALKKVLEG